MCASPCNSKKKSVFTYRIYVDIASWFFVQLVQFVVVLLHMHAPSFTLSCFLASMLIKMLSVYVKSRCLLVRSLLIIALNVSCLFFTFSLTLSALLLLSHNCIGFLSLFLSYYTFSLFYSITPYQNKSLLMHISWTLHQRCIRHTWNLHREIKMIFCCCCCYSLTFTNNAELDDRRMTETKKHHKCTQTRTISFFKYDAEWWEKSLHSLNVI